MNKGYECICYTSLSFWHCAGEGFSRAIVWLLSTEGVACRVLAVKEWNHEVDGRVVVSVIDLYLGWECFSIAG